MSSLCGFSYKGIFLLIYTFLFSLLCIELTQCFERDVFCRARAWPDCFRALRVAKQLITSGSHDSVGPSIADVLERRLRNKPQLETLISCPNILDKVAIKK